MSKRIAHRIEEIFLALIILWNIFDFLELLPGDLDFAKKIVSWAAIGYLFLKASPTSIFFANKNISLDIMIILSYFCLIVKNLVAYAIAAADESHFMSSTLHFLAYAGVSLEQYFFYIGGVSLILLSFWMALRL